MTARQVSTRAFLERRPVFRLDEAAEAFAHSNRRATLERLRHHVATGRIKQVTRGVYARVPMDVDPGRFVPDAFLVAAAVRPQGVFSHHSALELLGAAHSDWQVLTLLTERRRSPLDLGGQRIVFLPHPRALVRTRQQSLGITRIDRKGATVRVTGAERTLLDGFRSPQHVGGVAELAESAAGLPVLDLKLLRALLEAYAEKRLYAAAGWFLETHQATFSVPQDFLAYLEANRPAAPQYLIRRQRGGTMARRWRLILPEALTSREPDDR